VPRGETVEKGKSRKGELLGRGEPSPFLGRLGSTLGEAIPLTFPRRLPQKTHQLAEENPFGKGGKALGSKNLSPSSVLKVKEGIKGGEEPFPLNKPLRNSKKIEGTLAAPRKKKKDTHYFFGKGNT